MNPHNIPSLNDFCHSIDVQIRFSDVDVLGHVNNTIFFNYFDTGKGAFFTEILDEPIEWKEVETVVANVDCCYVAPIFYADKIRVYTRCEAISNRSFKLLQVIATADGGIIKSACETIMVAFDPKTQQAAPMPDKWRRALEKSMANCSLPDPNA